ncbi:hypothetical protein EfsSVR2281_31860 [Enterococcus faecalis]|nr:hypothetical protein EfsSVR2281_31860 [Enterococcus faecalis]
MDITFIDETEKVPTEEIKEIENLLQFCSGFSRNCRRYGDVGDFYR